MSQIVFRGGGYVKNIRALVWVHLKHPIDKGLSCRNVSPPSPTARPAAFLYSTSARGGYRPLLIFSAETRGLSSAKGLRNVAIWGGGGVRLRMQRGDAVEARAQGGGGGGCTWYRTTPRDQMSDFSPYDLLETISGLIQ
jgi:hypothetical protein